MVTRRVAQNDPSFQSHALRGSRIVCGRPAVPHDIRRHRSIVECRGVEAALPMRIAVKELDSEAGYNSDTLVDINKRSFLAYSS